VKATFGARNTSDRPANSYRVGDRRDETKVWSDAARQAAAEARRLKGTKLEEPYNASYESCRDTDYEGLHDFSDTNASASDGSKIYSGIVLDRRTDENAKVFFAVRGGEATGPYASLEWAREGGMQV